MEDPPLAVRPHLALSVNATARPQVARTWPAVVDLTVLHPDYASKDPVDPMVLAEHVRMRLARQICAQYTAPGGYLPLVAMSAQWEQHFAESIIGQGDDRHLAMQPSRLSEFITLVRDRFEAAAREGEAPVLVTSSAIRPFVRSIVERFRAQTPILSQAEIHPRVRLKTLGAI